MNYANHSISPIGLGIHELLVLRQRSIYGRTTRATPLILLPRSRKQCGGKTAALFEQVLSLGGGTLLPPDKIHPAHWPDWTLPSGGPNDFHTQWKLWLSDPEGYTPPPKPAD